MARARKRLLRICYGFGVRCYGLATEMPAKVRKQAKRPTPIPRVSGDFRPCSLAFENITNRGARIRTGDLAPPKAARYQAAPRPVTRPASLAPMVDRARHPDTALLASATAMADVQPLRALHYDLAVVGALARRRGPAL